jgi:hypothetical protein
VKTAITTALETVPSNIIAFPGQFRGKACAAGGSSTRIAPPAGMKSGGIHFRRFSQTPAQAKDSMHGLLAETREVLTRYFGVRAAMSRSFVDCRFPTGSRGLSLFAPPVVRGPDDSFPPAAATSIHRTMKISRTQARMNELFALKRHEKPPENFFRDFIQEFHRRIEPSTAKPRQAASRRNGSQSS